MQRMPTKHKHNLQNIVSTNCLQPLVFRLDELKGLKCFSLAFMKVVNTVYEPNFYVNQFINVGSMINVVKMQLKSI